MDSKYFSNAFTIYGVEGSLTFASKNKDIIIKNIKEKILKNNNTIKVNVLATVHRPEKVLVGTYLLYIAEIE